MNDIGFFSELIWLNEHAFEENREESVGHFPKERPTKDLLNAGLINLDKPAGPTSHEVVATVKRILGISKAGHSGTLDPNVSGILPIGLMKATKLLHTFHMIPKVYVCNMEVHDRSKEIPWEDYLEEFTGQIYQFPPLESNVKRRLRKRTIFKMELLETTASEVLFTVECEAGTYIRTLCEDLGRAAGVGAHMKELRRIRTGPFTEETRKTLHNLFDAYMDYKEEGDDHALRDVILPVEIGTSHLPELIVRNSAVWNVCHGVKLGATGILGYSAGISKGTLVAAKTAKGELIGLGTLLVDPNQMEGNKEVFKIDSVIIDQDLYPK
ncbi:MAG: RNA-guided pseudouridylation complex pseudouridine synthase subunit Cbf5 [Methanobacteriota archaeon]|nr:MAG: RNA-guided pseudouridylation complex pseudouridine synthase subunit Cbf5 [Euryarchaeota archaeon]